jgi:predicted aspartyl protease
MFNSRRNVWTNWSDPLRPFDDLSRRQFLQCGASSLLLASPLIRAHSAAPPNGAAEFSGADIPEREASLIAAANDAAKHMSVTVRIDGNGPYRFVVDTGADRTVLASDVAADLGLLRGVRVMMEGVVRAVPTETVAVDELSFGPVRCRHLAVPVLPRAMLQADGYLGLDTLDGHRVTFDFKNHTLQVSKPSSRLSALLVRQNEVRIRTTGSSGHLRAVNCLVDGIAATAFIDTGAEISAGNASLLAALNGRGSARREVATVPLTDITGGEILGNVTMVDKIQLMEVEFTSCPLVIADFQIFDVWGLTRQPALLIGMNFLRQFSRVSIDYGLKELRFDLTSIGGIATIAS